MVEENLELISSQDVCALLNIKPNNLYQINLRKQLAWVKKEGRNIFYDKKSVLEFKDKRNKRNSTLG